MRAVRDSPGSGFPIVNEMIPACDAGPFRRGCGAAVALGVLLLLFVSVFGVVLPARAFAGWAEIPVGAAGTIAGSPDARLQRYGFQSAVPLEDRLSAGTTGFLRTISKRFRQLRRVFAVALLRWQSWVGGALLFLSLAVIAPVLDREILQVWARSGLRAFVRELWAAIAVYTRLLRDARAPAVGKALLLFAVVYGVSNRDLMADGYGILGGLADDFLLVILASRSFMRMCDDEIVEEHAVRVAAARTT